MYRTVPFVILIALMGRAPAQAQQDTIFDKSGAPLRGTIIETSPVRIKIDVAGRGERDVSVNDIRMIAFGGEPRELQTAKERLRQGQIEAALEELNRVRVTDLERDLVRQDAQYYRAYCEGTLALAGGGEPEAALRAVLQFIGSHRNSYHYFDAARLAGDLAMSLGRHENAVQYYSALDRAPWPGHKLQAALLSGRALEAAGNYDEALERYRQVIESNVNDSDAIRQKALATVGKAACLAETGDPEQGIALLEELILDNDPRDEELFGRAYNALGRCYMKLDKTTDALLAFLHTDVVFTSEPDVHAEALYHLGQLWSQVNQSERSLRARSLLNDRYSGTRWARR